MKKSAAALIIALLVTAAAGTQCYNSALANPYSHIEISNEGDVPPRPDTQPPEISIILPQNNSMLAASNVAVRFDVEVGRSKSAESRMLWNVYYKADWLEKVTYVYEYVPSNYSSGSYTSSIANFSAILNLTEIPEGRHSITIYGTERGTYSEPPLYLWPKWSLNFTAKVYGFEITGASSFCFTIDVTPLAISLSPIKTEMVTESGVTEVPLNFTLSEIASKISFVLDGQDNVTIAGNTTLSGVNVGEHKVTVYAWDDVGNVGASETLVFSVSKPEPFPTARVAVASGASIAVVAAGVLFYFKKRKR